MKSITLIGVAVLAGLGVTLGLTNPSPAQYQEYAAQQLKEYIKNEVCTQAPKVFGNILQSNCNELIDSSRPGLERLITANTQRQNYIFFSIYTTDLSLGSVIPAYHFETVGAWHSFYTYTAEKR